jgi:hypothetical protein
MTDLAVAFLTLFLVALALLIVAIACLDELTDDNRALKKAAARRIRDLEADL